MKPRSEIRLPLDARRRIPLAIALIALAASVLVIGGCGSDSKAREELEAAGRKLSEAKSFEVSVLFEIEEEFDSEEVGCINLSIDSHKPVSVDLRSYDLNCSGGTEAHELIVVGHRAWASSNNPERWTEAKIARSVTKELDDEQTTDLQALFEAAENISSDPDGGATLEGRDHFVDAPAYYFDAPASVFPDAEDLGDTKVEFEAVIDRQGFLRELKLHGDEDGTGATVTETYEGIGSDFGIGPPDRSEVRGPLQQIRSRHDLDELMGISG